MYLIAFFDPEDPGDLPSNLSDDKYLICSSISKVRISADPGSTLSLFDLLITIKILAKSVSVIIILYKSSFIVYFTFYKIKYSA